MASTYKYWTRRHIPEMDRGHGLYSTQVIPRGKTVLTEYPERVIDMHSLDTPDSTIFGGKITNFDDYHTARQRIIKSKYPTILFKSPPQSLGNHSGSEGKSRVDIDKEEVILITPSAINHSCAPNMYRVDSVDVETRRLKCQYIATRNIKPGYHLTAMYDPILSEWELPQSRRAFLSAKYGFFCRCRKCASQSGWRDCKAPLSVPEDKMRQVLEMQPAVAGRMFPLGPNEQIGLEEGEEHPDDPRNRESSKILGRLVCPEGVVVGPPQEPGDIPAIVPPTAREFLLPEELVTITEGQGDAPNTPEPLVPLIVLKNAIIPQKTTVHLHNSNARGVPLRSIGNSATSKGPRKERLALWLEKTSDRTKAWLKNVQGEKKKTLVENKIPKNRSGPPKPGGQS